MNDDKEERKICEGCRTGNYFLCNSFPGQAKAHAEREVGYRRKKKRRVNRTPQTQVYQREDAVDPLGDDVE